jgi:anti-anti-sigma factor
MSELASVAYEERDAVQVASVRGEIDLSNADGLASELESCVPNRVESLVVDLSETTHLDSAGLRLLYGLKIALEARGQRLALVVPADALIRDVISITGLDAAVAVHPALEDAVRSVST